LKSGSLNLLEPSGPVQACNRIALPYYNIVRVKATFLYGWELGREQKNTENRLQVHISRCLRKMLNTKWPKTTTNRELWNKYKEEVGTDLSYKKRMKKENTALGSNPQGSRKCGRLVHT
jgi:hypothetical protein